MSEWHEQVALIQWCDHMSGQYPELGLIFAIPNQGADRKIAAVRARLCQAGMRPGIPDLFLPVPVTDDIGNESHGLFIEMKTKTGRLSKNQTQWLQKLSRAGYLSLKANGFEHAKMLICEYLGIKEES